MIRSISRTDGIDRLFKSYSEKYIFTGKKILIKINLARPPKDGHPRTDSILMKNVIDFLSEYSNSITLSESTDGYFEKNIQEIGLGEYLKSKKISLLEIDELETIDVLCNNQHIFIPKVFKWSTQII